jgi:hypothetical protein
MLQSSLTYAPVSNKFKQAVAGPAGTLQGLLRKQVLNPAQDSLALFRHLIKHFVHPGLENMVGDLCAGSGTGMIAGLLEGHNTLGLEKDPGQRDGFVQRLRRAQSDVDTEHRGKKNLKTYQEDVKEGTFDPLTPKPTTHQKKTGKEEAGETLEDMVGELQVKPQLHCVCVLTDLDFSKRDFDVCGCDVECCSRFSQA